MAITVAMCNANRGTGTTIGQSDRKLIADMAIVHVVWKTVHRLCVGGGWPLFEGKPMGAGDLSASEIFLSDNLGSQSAAPIGLDYLL